MDHVAKFVDLYSFEMTVVGITSAGIFLGSLVLVPWVIVRSPADGVRKLVEREKGSVNAHSPRWWVRNILGGLFLVAGVAMLVLPGQGLLTIVVGLGVMSFPGETCSRELGAATRSRSSSCQQYSATCGKAAL